MGEWIRFICTLVLFILLCVIEHEKAKAEEKRAHAETMLDLHIQSLSTYTLRLILRYDFLFRLIEAQGKEKETENGGGEVQDADSNRSLR